MSAKEERLSFFGRGITYACLQMWEKIINHMYVPTRYFKIQGGPPNVARAFYGKL